MTKGPVLIAGAGPTGLVLALELAYRKVPFKIIDKAKGPGETSRAMLVVPNVLESYQKYGLAQTVTRQGIIPDFAHFHSRNTRIASLPLGIMGKGQSLYSYLVTFPQDQHEQVLLDKLNEFGISVEWESELVGLKQVEAHSEVTIRKNGIVKTEPFNYVVGCDGASSQVRKQSGIDFEGETYEQVFYVLDAEVDGKIVEDDAGGFSFIKDYFALFFPLRNRETTRIIGMFPPDLSRAGDLSYESLKPRLEAAFEIKILEMNWFSDYKIHARTATHFRKGNLFLAGDAAHIHSPIGGQGMNLGIGDAVNLGWKLGEVINRKGPAELLDTYEEERKGIAEFVVTTTDRLFDLVVGDAIRSRLTRQLLIPTVASLVENAPPMQKILYTLLSQLYIAYENSDLSEGASERLKAGQRLPYVDSEPFEFIREAGWQLHTFKPIDPDIKEACDRLGITWVMRKWTNQTRDKGFFKEQWLLVRPDGYIGWLGSQEQRKDLERYIEKWMG
ncbi:2-polyprenyl-6-methoxyphenol hydroxylase [Alkalibacterium subtropicum]|uniref:2-polyprenyl-6-methoxyphenol hydroxylase n=1 Tax=Alkalibacterium subtropicum TaxID=753702 RepID=A0A1I1GM32_9LACT|nr:FAD-dependent monooxygenase [Alkalibacterium subtropicum]SFC12312.1 2-polyprenyl-6-methoxyphenol hydroxylase [Alkalibacterium subtropicum]